MRLLQIETENGVTGYVNVDHVVTVIAIEGGGATLLLSAGQLANIFETPDSFAARAQENKAKLGH